MKNTRINHTLKSAFLFSCLFAFSGCSEQKAEQTTEEAAESASIDHSDHGASEAKTSVAGETLQPTDNLTYLLNLNLMRGHLYVGQALYSEGHVEHAKTHMKHPESELYALVVPNFAALNADGFAEELEALAVAVESEKEISVVEEAYQTLSSAIDKAENLVPEKNASIGKTLQLIEQIVLVAAEEYEIAVVDGKLENAHEYQDSLGFVEVAETLLADTETTDASQAETKAKAQTILAALDPMWPGLVPPDTLTTEASQLYAAAESIHELVHH